LIICQGKNILIKRLLKNIFIGKSIESLLEMSHVESRRQTVMLLVGFYVGGSALVIFSIINFIKQEISQAVINVISFSLIFSGYLFLRWRNTVVISSYIFLVVFCVQLFILVSTDYSRAVWSFSVPLLTVFILGTRQGMILVSIYFVAVFLAFYAVWPMEYAQDFKIRYLATYICITYFSFYFEKNRNIAYKELEKVSARDNAILMSIPDIITEMDNNKRYTWMNNAGKTFFGKDIIGKAAADYFIEDVTYSKVASGGEEIMYMESWQRRKDGEKRLLAWWCRVLKDSKENITGTLSTARDITDTKKIEDQLNQSQKLAAIGRLAGGVAHEINNPLTVILGYSQRILKTEEGLRPGLKEQISMIEKASQRCKTLVQNLLEFAHTGNYTIEPVNTASEIEMGLLLLESKIKSGGVKLIKQVDVKIPVIQARKQALEQVIINLCSNAVDAMPKGGTLTVSAAVEKKSILINVADTGAGIPDGIKKNIFDPFFTTKEVGKGTGLGLSLCYEIVKKHGWEITVKSRLNEGTVFSITIPF